MRYLLQLVAQVILARLLGPENYGLFALALLVLTLSGLLSDLGLCWALIQAKDVTPDDVRFAATWQVISASAAAMTLYLAAPHVSAYFGSPPLEPVIRWLSVSCVISAASAPAVNLISRKLDFKTLNIIQVCSYAIGYLFVGIPMAYLGYGVWALVTAWIIQASCTLALAFNTNPYSLKPLFWHRGGAAIYKIGVTVFMTNICNWLLNNFDRIFLGRFLDVHSVGLYTAGYNLANTPNALLISALQPAFLAVGARVQDEPHRLRRAYLSVIGVIWVLVLPFFAMLAVLAPDLVMLLYGPRWQTTGAVLSILSLSMPAYITWGLSTPILWNTGRRHWECMLQLPVILCAAISLFSFVHLGVVPVAFVAASILILRAIVITTAACRRLGIGILDLCDSGWRAAMMATLVTAATYGGRAAAALVDDSPIIVLLGGGLVGAGTLVMAALVSPSLAGPAVADMSERFASAFPRARRIIRFSANKG